MKYYSLALTFFLHIGAKQSFEVLTFFLRDYPESNKTMKVKQTKEPKKYHGVPATHGGFLSISNEDGQITLPRVSQKPKIHILVTKEIKPIFLTKGTISHWEIKSPKNEFYTFTRKLNKETHIYLWSAKKSSLKTGKRVPLHTIVLIADPKNVYIPDGVTQTSKGVQLYLPDIYVKKDIDTADNAIFAAHIRQYFSPILKLYKGIPSGFETIIKSLT